MCQYFPYHVTNCWLCHCGHCPFLSESIPPPVVFLVVYSCCSVEANSFILHLTCFLFSSNPNSWLLICITVSVFIETYLQHERRNAHGFEREASRCFRKYALMSLLLAEVKAFTQLEKIIGFHNVTKLVSYMIFFFLTWSHSYDFVSVPGALWQAVTTITMVLTNLFLVIHQLR